MSEEAIVGKIHSAYRTLLARDVYLFSADANERSITHKLAEYVQMEFPEWDVDCEYNRSGLDTKRLSNLKETLQIEGYEKVEVNDINAVTVYPDIIVHHRGTDENLLVIEAKKSNFSGDDFDVGKLSAYKNELGYTYAFKVTFPVCEKERSDFDISTFVQRQ